MSGNVVRLRAPNGSEQPELSDEAIARACVGGDAGAVAALFDRFHQPVARYLGRLIGGGPDVEDLLQSTFMEVAGGRATYDPSRGAVSTWLFAIATNVVRHHRRSNARRFRLLSAVALNRSEDAADVGQQADARSKLRQAQNALNALSYPLREAFVLCELEGLSAKEASSIAGASEAAVWKRVSKARAALRREVLGGAS